MIQMLENILHMCEMDFDGHWDQYLPLAELHLIKTTIQELIWRYLRFCIGRGADLLLVSLMHLR